MTAEELAPFLDPPPPLHASSSSKNSSGPASASDGSDGAIYSDESFVLPALIKFGGEPFVDEEGHLLYRFPSLQRTGVSRVRPAPLVVCSSLLMQRDSALLSQPACS